ncbi:MAG TPA: hypothetical protein VHL08_07015 [Dongiaceae bacterium]|jgi:hypothetical protein|nr:hypothetical protein [Dongiaceae bacterium]
MLKIRAAIDSLLKNSYATLDIPPSLQQKFDALSAAFDTVSPTAKQEFSFFDDTDGFLPFGSEYSRVPENLDLCERFCYWRIFAERHRQYPLSHSPFYEAVAAYDREIFPIAQAIMDGLCDTFAAPRQPSIRDSSYLQFCAYRPEYQAPGRRYLQDPHEDGHLLSFIKPDREGLVLFVGGQEYVPDIGQGQVMILAGSLLEALSEGAIQPMQHAVRSADQPQGRKSLMYFVNPAWDAESITLRTHQRINLNKLANERHMSFGNHGLAQVS